MVTPYRHLHGPLDFDILRWTEVAESWHLGVTLKVAKYAMVVQSRVYAKCLSNHETVDLSVENIGDEIMVGAFLML